MLGANTSNPAHRARWYASFLDNIPAAVYRTSVEGQIVYCNRAMAELFGFDSPADLINTPVAELYQDMRARGYLVQGILINFEVADLLLPQNKKDGTPMWCRVHARAVLDDEGVVEFIDEWVRDVSEEIGEAEADATLLRLINAANNFVIFFDLEGRILDMDPSGYEALGLEKLDVLGMALTKFVVPEDADLVHKLFSDVFAKGEGEAKIRVADSAGGIKTLLLKAFLKTKGDQHDHVVCIARDMEEEEKIQDDLANASKLEGVLEMAGGVSHRLNQPLMVISNMVQGALQSVRPEDPLYAKMQAIEEQVQELNIIAKKISGIVKYEATDYVWGVKIVDLDKASSDKEQEE